MCSLQQPFSPSYIYCLQIRITEAFCKIARIKYNEKVARSNSGIIYNMQALTGQGGPIINMGV